MEAANEKKFGASKVTIDMLRLMSGNVLDFITRCADWEAGKAGIRTQKKDFQLGANAETPGPGSYDAKLGQSDVDGLAGSAAYLHGAGRATEPRPRRHGSVVGSGHRGRVYRRAMRR